MKWNIDFEHRQWVREDGVTLAFVVLQKRDPNLMKSHGVITESDMDKIVDQIRADNAYE